MQELTKREIQQVHGGVLPLLAAAYALATNIAVRSVGSYVLSRAFTVYAVYSAASHYGFRT